MRKPSASRTCLREMLNANFYRSNQNNNYNRNQDLMQVSCKSLKLTLLHPKIMRNLHIDNLKLATYEYYVSKNKKIFFTRFLEIQ